MEVKDEYGRTAEQIERDERSNSKKNLTFYCMCVVLFFTIGFLTFLCLQGLDKLTKWLGFFDEKE